MSKKVRTDVIGSTIPVTVIAAIDEEVSRLSSVPGVVTSRSAFVAGAVEMRVRWREVRDGNGELVALVKPGATGVAFAGVTARDPIMKDGKDG